MLGTSTGVRRERRWQRRLLLVLLGAVLAALGASFASVLAGASPLARSTVDRPDDSPEPQIHVLYVLPSDRGDRELDTNGTLESSVAAFQRWLAGQTGGRVLRLDTSGGSSTSPSTVWPAATRTSPAAELPSATPSGPT